MLIPGVHGPLIAATCGRIEEQQCIFTESGCIFTVLPSASGKNRTELIRFHHNAFMFPCDQVTAYRISPVHIAPFCTVWIPLMIQEPDPIRINQAIRIVDPAGWRRKVDQRPAGITGVS